MCFVDRNRSGDGYSVANSDYERFANVLSRFEAAELLGTAKAKDSLQVLHAPGSP